MAPDASDWITIFGVPLAVAGGIPLLYGFGEAMWIWFKLSRSIPWQLRDFITLIPDPVSGTVVVCAKWLKLMKIGLWRPIGSKCNGRTRHKEFYQYLAHFYNPPKDWWNLLKNMVRKCRVEEESDSMSEKGGDPPRNDEQLDDEKISKRFIKSEHPYATMGSDNSLSTKSHRGIVLPPNKLYRPWMHIALQFGFDLEEMEYLSEESQPTLSSANLDWQTTVPPLSMTWEQFVWLAFGMGMRPDNFTGLKYGDRIRTADDFNFKVSRTSNTWTFTPDRVFTECFFSLRTALTAVDMMLLERNGTLVVEHRGGDGA